MKVIFKNLNCLDGNDPPGINDDMKKYFDGETIREIGALNPHLGNYYYKGWSINPKWFDEYHEHKKIMELFNLEL